jgi:hypothetical protein
MLLLPRDSESADDSTDGATDTTDTTQAPPATDAPAGTDATDGDATDKTDGEGSGQPGRLVAFVDRDATEVGKRVPREDGIYRFDENRLRLSELPTGEHEVIVAVTDPDYKLRDPLSSATVVFTVDTCTPPTTTTGGEATTTTPTTAAEG